SRSSSFRRTAYDWLSTMRRKQMPHCKRFCQACMSRFPPDVDIKPITTRSVRSTVSLLLHAVEMLLGADKEGVVADRIGSQRPLLEAGVGQLGEFRARLDHKRGPFFGLNVNFSVGKERRGRIAAA